MNRAEPDLMWQSLLAQAQSLHDSEAMLGTLLESTMLASAGFAHALARLLAAKLLAPEFERTVLVRTLQAAYDASPALIAATQRDLAAIVERDPSTDDLLSAFLFHKGFHALQAHRSAHWHWGSGRRALASFLQNRVSEVFAVDIHPAARIGSGVFIDHATGVVIGETATVGDDVSMLQEVTLGGTGKDKGDRHPKVGNGVLLCAGVKVLGNIRIGEGARIGACSVVLDHVRPYTTMVGVPARAVREFAPRGPHGAGPLERSRGGAHHHPNPSGDAPDPHSIGLSSNTP